MTFVSYAQNFEDVLLWRAFKTVGRGFYIDVGAYDSEVDSVTLAFYKRGWRGINVEPNVDAFRSLREERPRDINLNVALSDSGGSATFYTFEDTGLSTLSRRQADAHRFAGRAMQTRTVPLLTLADLCRRHVDAEIHFLKVDVEGSEREVLAGGDFARFRPIVVVVEATKPMSSVVDYAGWEPLLLAADYRFLWFDGLNRFYAAAEHFAEIKPHFEVPPNCFDQFVSRRIVTVEKRSGPPPRLAVNAHLSSDERTAMTARCRDADPIPKVADAGIVSTAADGTRIQTMHNGVRVVADGYYGAWMTRLIELCRGHHEPQEERLFHEVVSRLDPGGTMIDLGAFWAFYSIWFLKSATGRRAIAVEPDRAHRAVGKANAALNDVSIELVDGYVGTPISGAFRTETSGVTPLAHVDVPQLMQERGIERLDILHCDSQGTEFAVLESCIDLFREQRIGWVFVSTHAQQISGDWLTHQRCLTLLREAGATIEAEHDVHESFSGDGLIVARFGPAPAGWTPIEISRNRYSESHFRNPIHDLAEQGSTIDEKHGAAFVDAVFETLLLRHPDQASRTTFVKSLAETGNLVGFMRRIMRSSEFKKRLPQILDAHGLANATDAPPHLESAAFKAVGATFALKQDGPLGRQGDRLSLPHDSVMGPNVLKSASWQAETIAFFGEHLDGARRYTLLDIGANIGLVSRQLLHAHPCIAACICVEPDPGNFQALAANLAVFDRSRTTLFNCALGLDDGSAVLFRDRANIGNYSLNADAVRGQAYDERTVVVRDTADWMHQTVPTDGPLIWKSDTQGHDELIVAQTPWSVWDRVECAVIELWRIGKQPFDTAMFREKIAAFPHRTIAGERVTAEEALDYASDTDGRFVDLFLWR